MSTEEECREVLADIVKPEAIDAWFDAHLPAFDGRTPRQVIRSGEGEELLNLLYSLRDNAFT